MEIVPHNHIFPQEETNLTKQSVSDGLTSNHNSSHQIYHRKSPCEYALRHHFKPPLDTHNNGSRTPSSVHSSIGRVNSGSPLLGNCNLLVTTENMSRSSGSHSITPPNSNSNTTISCGSGNSTMAHLGAPTTPKSSLNHNNNNNNLNHNDKKGSQTPSSRQKAKKCILEEGDNDIDTARGMKQIPVSKKRASWAVPTSAEFLPICDALFNVISLAAYFSEIVFDILTAYTWYGMSQNSENFPLLEIEEGEDQRRKSEWMWQWSIAASVFILLSTVMCQILSFKWYKESTKRGQIGPDGAEIEGPPTPCSTSALVLMHLSMCGVLCRYFKLFIPVDLRFIKNEMRDLCLLRLVHAFTCAMPMLLMQLYHVFGASGPEVVSDFTIVSTSLCLFNVCWALASFNKNIRKKNLHRFMLTWIGLIFQFGSYLGIITCRALALALYAEVYQFYVFLVLCFHWLCCVLWLLSPKNLYQGEKISLSRKVMYSSLLAVVYTFCYINVKERKSRQKAVIYYVTLFAENCLLLGVWLIAKRYEDVIWYRSAVVYISFSSFGAGIICKCLYYKYFHVKRMSYAYDTSSSSYKNASLISNKNGINSYHHHGGKHDEIIGVNDVYILCENKNGGVKINGNIIANGGYKHKKNPELYQQSLQDYNNYEHGRELAKNKEFFDRGFIMSGETIDHQIHHPNVPGVFNCRFHPAMKRKKKKPTTFVPPAVQTVSNSTSSDNKLPFKQTTVLSSPFNQLLTSITNDSDINMGRQPQNLTASPHDTRNGKMSHPFWKRRLSTTTLGSENEGSVGSSRTDIQRKLQEKKQQQLDDLREIEEEIKQGKLQRPEFNEIPQSVTPRQPIPVEKKKPWIGTQRCQEDDRMDPSLYFHPKPPYNMVPGSDPNDNEVLLNPRSLISASPQFEGSSEYCFYDNPDWQAAHYCYDDDVEGQAYQNNETIEHSSGSRGEERERRRRGGTRNQCSKESIYKSYRVSSDVESHMSLPRSYTLPREFKHKVKLRKSIKTDQFVPSTNSSDGDVDSGEDQDSEIYGPTRPYPLPSSTFLHSHNLENRGCSSAPQTSKGKQPVSHRHKLHETKL